MCGEDRVVHAEHLKRYADSSLRVTPQLKAFVAAQAVVLRVAAITGHRKDKNVWRLRVAWDGFTDEDATWETLQGLYKDVPEMVSRYVKTIQDEAVRLELSAVVALYRTAKN